MYDFYYSEKQKYAYRLTCFGKEPIRLFKGFLYTECCEIGKKPVGVWDDYRLIGTGTFDDVTINGNSQKGYKS